MFSWQETGQGKTEDENAVSMAHSSNSYGIEVMPSTFAVALLCSMPAQYQAVV
jgi:hypothetical protein